MTGVASGAFGSLSGAPASDAVQRESVHASVALVMLLRGSDLSTSKAVLSAISENVRRCE
jgi:hypothetical protein